MKLGSPSTTLFIIMALLSLVMFAYVMLQFDIYGPAFGVSIGLLCGLFFIAYVEVYEKIFKQEEEK